MNMFLEIVRFELLYRFKRPATYIYFGLFLGISFFMAAVPEVTFTDAADQVLKNSPYLITQVMLIILITGSIVCAGIMGVPVFRDYDHEFYEIIHSLPIRKSTYLWGRFTGSFLVTLFVFTSVGLGMALGFSMPWLDPEMVAPFDPSVYIEAYLYFIIPDLFITGSLFFIAGSYFRSHIAIYTQGVIFLVLYLVSDLLLQNAMENPLFTLFDPFGAEAISRTTIYWTSYEKNILHILPGGLILQNRIVWISFALVIAVLFNWRFSVTRRKVFSLFRKKHDPNTLPVGPADILPEVIPINLDFRGRLVQWWHISLFYLKDTIRSIPFLVTLVCAIGFMILTNYSQDNMYNTPTLPVTYMLLDKLSTGFMIFTIVLLVVYSGELIWKDIHNRFAAILDSSPLSDQQIILSKFTAMILAELLMLVVIILTGMGMQAFLGFFEFQLAVYFKFLFLNFFPMLFLMTLLTFFIHTLVNNKYLGHALIILFYIAQGFYGRLGIWDRMFQYANYPRQGYSGMNGFDKFIFPALSFEFYWLMFGLILLGISMLFLKRGSENSFGMRLRLFRIRLKAGHLKYYIPVAILLFILSGSFVYYNTHILNTYRSKKEERLFRARYERTYERFRDVPQPRVTDVNIQVDIYPEEYGVKARGTYTLVNKNPVGIDSVHVRVLPEFTINHLAFGKTATCIHKAPEYGYYIYRLGKRLEPGDTLEFTFDISCFEKGFSNWGRPTNIVPNGTFFTNTLLPGFGYNESLVLTDKRERRKAGLPPNAFEASELTDSSAYGDNYISMNADRINYEAVVSTSSGQTALTCGNLIKRWSKDGRDYFQYKMNVPIWNFVPFLSARYAVLQTRREGIDMEIYYHPEHDYNTERMSEAMEKAIAYCSSNFSPFQYDAIRIAEFPRYGNYAQSFPGIIPFSEGIGFIVDVDEKKGLDLPFYVTAHEVAHQWWGHQVSAADVKGKLLLIESLANYSAIMIMEKEFGKENAGRFLEYEQANYLRNRSIEQKNEVPLKQVDDQLYIAYQKGSIALYSLRHYLGEEKLNEQLSRFLMDYRDINGPYPTSEDLIRYLGQAIPDSLSYLVEDLFEKITLYSNRLQNAGYKASAEGGYDITVQVKSQKFHADELGKQEEVVPDDWIDLGIYTREYKGEDSLGHLQKVHLITRDTLLQVHVGFKPGKVSLDPYHILIDRNLKDNVKVLP
ncbi:MAG: hypothetical protein JW801_16970 [Bacteroidales bacterium]|nr:hypothetical protein [Bacteroidales bacterium]